MSVLNDSKKLNAYSLDMQPANVYIGESKVAGWHASTFSGQSPLAVDCGYNVPPDALAIDGKCSQVQSCWGTNLVTNGDFSSGITGWRTYKSNLSVSQNTASVLATGQYGQIFQTVALTIGHKYYFCASIKASSTSIGIKIGNTEFYHVGNGLYQNLSVLYTSSANSAAIILLDKSAFAWQTFYCQHVSVIDLTAAFGAGKEPTAAQMDAIMAQHPNSWFDGSAQLSTDTTKYTPNSPSPSFPAPISTITGDVTITGAYGAASDTATVAFGPAVCASLPDGTHDTYDAVTGALTKRVGKVVFDGSASGFTNNNKIAGQTEFFITGISSVWGSVAVSDRFLGVTPYALGVGKFRVSESGIVPVIENSRIGVLDTDTDAVKIAAFKSWLAANPVTVYYKLATPTTTQLTPHLPVVRTGIKTLSVGADVVPTLSATVKSMESAITSITQG